MKAIGGVKIFFMSDCDWVAAKDMTEAREFYIKHCGLDEEDQAQLEITELSDFDAQRLVFHDENGEPTSMSFATEVEKKIERGELFPQLFASTEY